jgi:hypothetical protein
LGTGPGREIASDELKADGANVIAMPAQAWLELVELRRQDGLESAAG